MKYRKTIILLCDLALVLGICAFMIGLLPSSETSMPPAAKLIHTMVIIVCLSVFRVTFRVYDRIWRYASTREYLSMVKADVLAGALFYMLNFANLLPVRLGLVRCVSIFSSIGLGTLCMRLFYRTLIDHRRLRAHASETGTHNRIRIAIVGAGNVGTMLAKELQRNPYSHYEPYCFIDTDPNKANGLIAGIKVIPETPEIIDTIKHLPIQEIVIALPKLSGDEKREIYQKYVQTGCKVKLYDYPLENSAESTGTRTLREFKIEELLFRDSVHFDADAISSMYHNKTILVTGGGGSIGSELVRQLTAFAPKRLVIFDIYENNAYDLEQELLRKFGDKLDLVVEIGSVRDIKRLKDVFALHRPQVVFHAAAHKHVPLMEHSCGEAVKNNVFGTLNTVNVAEAFGVERFLLVSTDKAVNPTNVMGASKRLCEMIVQSRKNSATSFVAVRFGNVLGSNGSVIPLFAKQIQSGGPVTLTDKRIIRYFMTIPEAAQLLLQTCAMAISGEIYVLDMGRPVKILEMAENMIRLCGLTPYVDIAIKEIGLRPGEKLYEELLIKTENLVKTENSMIFIERDDALSQEEMNEKLHILEASLESGNPIDIINALRKTVTTYHAAEEVNLNAESAAEMQIVSA